MQSTFDLIDVAEAARVAERSDATIRRWMRDGLLARHEGPTPEHGGSAPVLVDRNELLTYLASSGQQPRVSREDPGVTLEGSARGNMNVAPPSSVELELVELRARLATAELEGRLNTQLAEVRGELAAARAELEAVRRQVNQLDHELVDARRDRDDWRDRHDAREAELSALRSSGGGSWWRRLLGGPTIATG